MGERKSRLRYAGISREEYIKIEPLLMEENENKLRLFSLIGAILFAILGMAAFLGLSNENELTYFAAAAAMLLIFGTNELLLRSKREDYRMESVLIALFLAVMYMEAFEATLDHPEVSALSYICVMLILPLLFLERPYRIICVQIASSIACCILMIWVKELRILTVDLWDTITFLVPSIASILFVVPLRVEVWKKYYDLDYARLHDTLTELKNRKAWEEEMERLSDIETDQKQSNFSLILAEVSGLREMNESKGESAGDSMLRAVAAGVQKHFEEDAVYRTGGIEFTALCREKTPEEITEAIQQMDEEFSDQGYHVFFSTARTDEESGEASAADPETVIKLARQRLSEAKAAYYGRRGADRRRR